MNVRSVEKNVETLVEKTLFERPAPA